MAHGKMRFRELPKTLNYSCLGMDMILAAALSLAQLSADGDEAHRAEAIASLESALVPWQAYAAVATSHCRPRKLARSMPLDLCVVTPQVRADIDRARIWKAPRP